MSRKDSKSYLKFKIRGAMVVEIKTNRLNIRNFQEKDLEQLWKLLIDPEVMRYLEEPYSKEKTKKFLQSAGLCNVPLIYAVDTHAGDFIGYVIYHPYEQDSYEIGWVIAKEYWHKGYAQELTEAFIQDAKTKTKSLVIECVPEQLATKRIVERNGFRYMGNSNGCEVYRRYL